MASGVVRGAISTVLGDPKLVQASRSDKMREFGELFLAKIAENDEQIELFDTFCDDITSELNKIFTGLSKRIRCPSTKRTRLWSAFHDQRQTKLLKLWQDLFSKQGISDDDQLFLQSVNQELFQLMLVDYMEDKNKTKASREQQVTLSADELNAMQYACGYVPHKLLKRYESRRGAKVRRFVECLGNMAVVCEDSDPDLLAYTRLWIERVNRGSLFPLNDETFHFFIQIEKVVRVLLPKHIVKTDSDIGVQKVIKQVLEDEDVQFNWTLISQDLDSYEEAQELLYEIVRLWVTIRGFSIASMWMETYKQATKQTKQKSTGLRKHLS